MSARGWLLVAALALPALAGAAAPAVLPFDPAQSQVQFSVRKFWFVHVRGTFPDVRGAVHRITTSDGADLAEVDATLAVSGLRMDDAHDREHALGDTFFDARRFPVIRFDSDPFPWLALTTGGPLRGMLTLHGERHPVTLTVQPSECPMQPVTCMIRVEGSISRSAFGMRAWRGVLSDRVRLDLRITLRAIP